MKRQAEQSEPSEPLKSTPPYLPNKTFFNTLAGWGATGLPNRIDRTLFRSFSGAMQSWLISTLRYFGLIDPAGHPTDRLRKLVKAQGTERQKVYAEMIMHGYQFVLADGLELSSATLGQLQERFKDTGLQGDTVRKAIALFLALAKEAGFQPSPYLKISRQRRSGSSQPQRRTPKKENTSKMPPSMRLGDMARTPPATTPIDMLIEILDPAKMDKSEQEAVWTLIRYLKKGE